MAGLALGLAGIIALVTLAPAATPEFVPNTTRSTQGSEAPTRKLEDTGREGVRTLRSAVGGR